MEDKDDPTLSLASSRLEVLEIMRRMGLLTLVTIGVSQAVIQWKTVGWVAAAAYSVFYFGFCGLFLWRILWRITGVAIEEERRRAVAKRVEYLKTMRELSELELYAQRERHQKIMDIKKIQEDMDD